MTAPDSSRPAASAESTAARAALPHINNYITEIIERDLGSGKYGSVVTRFPPEPNGYLHLGHTFASFLDFQTAVQYGGRYHLRLDDTNPEGESQEFAEGIMDDLRWLGWDWGEKVFYASDNFEQYYAYAEQLIIQGDAYVDSVNGNEMARLRGDAHTPGTPSEFRGRSVEENLELFRRMRAGEFADGAHVLRGKIDLGSANMKLRDPVLYRIKRAWHYRAGDAWCIYPMYDFQHPLQDAIEGVTHSMCSLEFVDNRAIYDWLMEKLAFAPRPHQYEFGRRSLEYTIVSKRKLRQLVNEGHVSGWDDPRMPTLRAQQRLGVRPEAVLAFASQIGVSRTNRTVDIAVYENAVRDDLNHRAPRVMAVLDPLRVMLDNLDGPRTLQVPYWPYDVVDASADGLVGLPGGERVAPEQAVRDVALTSGLFIEREDFSADPPKGYKRLTPGGTVRLRGAGIIRADGFDTDDNGNVTHIHATLLDEGAKAGGVIHWVSAENAIPAEFRLYDRLFRVSNPEGENPDDIAPEFDPEQPGHESGPVDTGFLRYLNPESLRVTHGYVEASVANDPADTRYQFERQGYFWRDPVDSRDGALVYGRIITLKDAWAGRADGGKPKPEGKRSRTEAAPGSAGGGVQPVLTPEQEMEVTRLTGLGASDGDARTVARDDVLLAFLADAKSGETFAQVASWTVNDLATLLRAGEVKIRAADLAPLATLLASGTVTSRVARDTLARAAASGEAPAALIEREGLNAGLDDTELGRIVAEILEKNPTEAEAYRGGKTALLGFFTGQVMRATRGKAEPGRVAGVLKGALDAG
ncbi:glutamine--tRNA ligase/YqeY domain fusion protein [Deinococcus arenicola]|uniref:Glutamine--tRNA ligase n=1 Tax=Deinococcus arenicola TaxID=2994950 RepID=A0ABU4DL17_9DEIO|nr:glutamine--tRNA ligase/YqeY domain fusion protein [Deinococcus sp. ZS9-10]MDV6373128.1 glutamine--tRNA ligase/YqeY domain fusion protein [Deinococcus sp. ZS9-10]